MKALFRKLKTNAVKVCFYSSVAVTAVSLNLVIGKAAFDAITETLDLNRIYVMTVYVDLGPIKLPMKQTLVSKIRSNGSLTCYYDVKRSKTACLPSQNLEFTEAE